jgi:hypothetical protein
MWEYYPEHPIESFRAKRSWAMWPLVPLSPLETIDKANSGQWWILNSPEWFEKLALQEKWEIFGSKLLYYMGSHMIQVDKMAKESKKLEWEVMKFLDYLSEKWFLINIHSFSFEKWMCSMQMLAPPNSQNKNIFLNLTRLFTAKWLYIWEFERAMSTKEDLSKLRESLETELLFGWAVVISYEQKEWAKKALWVGIWGFWLVWAFNTGEYMVKKMFFRDEYGKMQEVEPKIIRDILQKISDKTRINSLVFKIMRESSRVYNPIRNAFTEISTLAFDRSLDKLRLLKRSDIPDSKNISEKDFEFEKQKAISTFWKIPIKNIIDLTSKVGKATPWVALQGIIYSTFFADYHKHSYDIAQFYRGFAEAGLFEIGASIGKKITPWAWKVPWALIWWWLAIVWGTIAGGAIGIDKKLWRALPERVSGDSSKWLASHIITGGVIHDLADTIDTDLGVPWTRGGTVLYNPFGKDGIIPNIDFAGTHITFGTDPREYLQSRRWGTDIHWNKQMNEYVLWATDLTMKILHEYDNNRWYFASSNGKKDDLLRERLRYVFDSEDGKNKRNAQIIEDCMDYTVKTLTKVKDLNSRKELLSIFLSNYGNILKIDKESLEYDERLIERDKSIINSQVEMYKSLLPQKKRQLVDIIFSRLQNGDRLLSGKIVVKQGGRGGLINSWQTDKKESDLYRELIDDPTPITEEWFDILRYKEYTLESIKWQLDTLDKKYGIAPLSWAIHREISPEGPWRNIRNTLLENLASKDPVFRKKTEDLRKTIRSNPSFPITISSDMTVLTWAGTFHVNDILREYANSVSLLSKKNAIPTRWDIFIYLLNIHTEYREQKRYIDTQKSIGYANKWRSF